MRRSAAWVLVGALAPVTGWAQSAPALRINEFLPNPAVPSTTPGGTADDGFEWIEIYNADAVTVDLAGFKLQRKTAASATSWTGMYTFPTGDPNTQLAPGDYLVVADDPTYVPGADFYKGAAGAREALGMGGGSGGDGIRLVTSTGTTADTSPGIVDVVVYGATNTDGIEDQVADPATSLAPNPTPGGALARAPNGVDTNLSGADFVLVTSPTMGAANPNPPSCDAATGLVINELLPNPSGTGSTLEYVEIYNGAGRTVKLEAYRLEWGTSSFSSSHVFASTVEIASGDWLVVGGSGVTGRDVEANLSLGDAGSNADAVRLKDCQGAVLDTVVYGTPNDSAFADDSGSAATSLAPKPSDGDAIARREDGVDSNLSADDFFLTTSQTPGADNPTPPVPGVCEPDTDTIAINEVFPNPAGSDLGHEWVEIYNRGSSPRRLDGWTIRAATTTATFSIRATLPSGLEVPAGGRILVGEASVSGATATVTKLDLGSGNDGDAVRLVDCAGNVVDTVAYSDGGNGDGVLDDSGAAATSLASAPGDGQSLARKRDGVDTDASAEDFAVTANPTPGAANPELICVQNTGNVKLNEILPDPDGSDSEAAAEFIELYNAGSEAVDLDGWQFILSGAGDDRSIDFVLPPSTRIPAETFLVIGNANVAEADVEIEFSMGNGTGGDGVFLLDCTGAMVDAVAYGPDNTDLVTNESGQVAQQAANPGSARSLARVADGVDANLPGDWFVDTTPTPGATNFQEGVDIPDDDDETGGCGRNEAPGGGAPEGGCATVPVSMGGMALVPLLFAIRRRRRG